MSDPDRLAAILANLLEANPNSASAPDKEAAEAAAWADLDAVRRGPVVDVPWVGGYLGDTDNSEDRYPPDGGPHFRVIVTGADRPDIINWTTEEDLDPRWNIIPAPGETRLTDMRSLWCYGRCYRLLSEAAEPVPHPDPLGKLLPGFNAALAQAEAADPDNPRALVLAANLEDGAGADIWFDPQPGEEDAAERIEQTKAAMSEAAALLRDAPLDALKWMLLQAVESSSERLEGLNPDDARLELTEVEAVVKWFADIGGDTADLVAAMVDEDTANRIRAAGPDLEKLRAKALDALGVVARLNTEFCNARDAGNMALASAIDLGVQAANSEADTAQLRLLEASGVEPDFLAPDGSAADIAAKLKEGGASIEEVQKFCAR